MDYHPYTYITLLFRSYMRVLRVKQKRERMVGFMHELLFNPLCSARPTSKPVPGDALSVRTKSPFSIQFIGITVKLSEVAAGLVVDLQCLAIVAERSLQWRDAGAVGFSCHWPWTACKDALKRGYGRAVIANTTNRKRRSPFCRPLSVFCYQQRTHSNSQQRTTANTGHRQQPPAKTNVECIWLPVNVCQLLSDWSLNDWQTKHHRPSSLADDVAISFHSNFIS